MLTALGFRSYSELETFLVTLTTLPPHTALDTFWSAADIRPLSDPACWDVVFDWFSAEEQVSLSHMPSLHDGYMAELSRRMEDAINLRLFATLDSEGARDCLACLEKHGEPSELATTLCESYHRPNMVVQFIATVQELGNLCREARSTGKVIAIFEGQAHGE